MTFVELSREVLDIDLHREVAGVSLLRPEEAMPSAAEGRGSTRGPLRTRRAARLSPRWPTVAWPRAGVGCGGGGRSFHGHGGGL